MSKSNRKSLFVRLIDWVWRNPKANISEGIKKTCDDMLPKQRLMVVTVLLSAFVLIAFFVFGHACYKIGARQAHNQIEIEHLQSIDPIGSKAEEYAKQASHYDADEWLEQEMNEPTDKYLQWEKEQNSSDSIEPSKDSANDSTGMESED